MIIFCALFVFPAFSDNEQGQSAEPGKQKVDRHVANGVGKSSFPLDELQLVKEEFRLLRQQFSEVLLKSDAQNRKFLLLESSIVSALEGSDVKEIQSEYVRLVESYESLRQTVERLETKVLDLDSFVEEIMGKDKLQELDRTRLKCKMEDLVHEAEKIDKLMKIPKKTSSILDSCGIVSVNDVLQLVVLDAGFADGLSCGLVCVATDKSGKKTLLKIIALRPFVSAALVIEGDINDLLPSMNVKIGIVN